MKPILLLFLSFQTLSQPKKNTGLQVGEYIVEANDAASQELADSFFVYLKNRTKEDIVKRKKKNYRTKTNKATKIIKIQLDGNSLFDYQIETAPGTLTLKGKSEKTLLWLFHQYYKELAKADHRFFADDLPPSIINFGSSSSKKFAFSYREPFYRPNIDPRTNIIYGTNNVEEDWGIWGHNLTKLLQGEKNTQLFSTVNGKKNREQICFSSDATYRFIEKYILTNFGEQNVQSFVIAPSDNPLVCTGPECSKIGNSKTNAAPAVLKLLERLAKRFPKHTFYTLGYLSVQPIISKKLPPNTGVLVSAMDLPQRASFKGKSPQQQDFESRVEQWKKITSNIMAWDYTTNFDDYLSPYPSLSALKNRLLYFKKLGISGVFCNASGYDYSSFQDVKTFVSASLLINPELNVNSLVSQFFGQFYPVFGKSLSHYYLSLESSVKASNRALDIYSGITKSVKTYLDPPRFFAFYQNLLNSIPTADGYEKENLKKLATALSFTYLQLSLHNRYGPNGFATLAPDRKVSVKKGFIGALHYLRDNYKAQGITTFNEREIPLKVYLEEINAFVGSGPTEKSKIFLAKVNPLSELDEDYTDLSILTDGIPGFLHDYHRGWLLVSFEDLSIGITMGNLKEKTYDLQFSFLQDEKLKLTPPDKIEIFINNEPVRSIFNTHPTGTAPQRIILGTTLKIATGDQVKIKYIRNKKYQKFATDEITIF